MTLQTFNSSGTFTPPGGVTVVNVLLVGGGGGSNPAAGGGGGEVKRVNGIAVTPGVGIAVTVGGGGSAGSAVAAGGDGGPSSFGAQTANGGGGASSINGGTSGNGNPGGSGSLPNGGGGGGNGGAGSGTNGGSGTADNITGSSVFYGGGGAGWGGSAGAGANGANATNTSPAAAGFAGIVIISYVASGPQTLFPAKGAFASVIQALLLTATTPLHVIGGGLSVWGSATWGGLANAPGKILSLAHWASASVIHAPLAQLGVYTISPGLWPDPSPIRMPQVGFAQVLDPGLWPSQAVIRVPALAAGVVTVSPALWPNVPFIPTLGLTIAPEHFLSETFYAPTITVGEFIFSPEHFDAERTYYPPQFVLSGNSIHPDLVGQEIVHDPAILYQPPDPVYLYPVRHQRGSDYGGSRRPGRLVVGRR